MADLVSLRIGDTEREAAVSALGEHLAAGRISLEEFDERAGRAWAAQYNAQLDELFRDLPQPRRMVATPPPRPATRQQPRRIFFPVFFPAVPIAVAVVIILANAAPWLLFMLVMLWIFGPLRMRNRARRHRHGFAEESWSAGRPADHRDLCRFGHYGRV